MRDRIYLCLAHMSGNEQKFIQEAFDTNWVVPLGPNVNGFEADLENFIGEDKKIVALSSGTAAIHLSLVLLGVSHGDEVICQSFTFCASANPIVYCGATPIFVDSEDDTWNMSPVLLRKAIEDRIAKGKKPKAIVLVYLYGMPAKIDEILAIANEFDIPIVEDAVEALGSEYKGRKCGVFGKYGVLSFNGNKIITTSGGGALICSDEESKLKTVFYATQAREKFPYYQHEEIGYNYRMSNICAGIGRGQMTIIDDHIAHHRHVHETYKQSFDAIDGIELKSACSPDFKPNYWLCTILVDEKKLGISNEQLRQYLDTKNIESRPLWKPMHLQPIYKDAPAYIDGTSEHIYNCGLCLPSGPMVTDDDVHYIIDSIKEAVIK